MKTVIMISLLMLMQTVAAAEKSEDAFNLTTKFESLYAAESQTTLATLRDKVENYQVIMVPGILSDLGRLVNQRNFGEFASWLQHTLNLENGKDFMFAPTNSFATSKANARVLAALIAKSTRPIVFIAHSKGGLDVLETLLTWPQLQSKVKGIITLQSPFHGTVVADRLAASFSFRALMCAIFKIGQGDVQAYLGLQTSIRRRYMERYRAGIATITGSIPVINVVGWIHQRPWYAKEKTNSIYSRFINLFTPILIGRGYYDNDYLVPKHAQLLPGAYHVDIEGLDHLSLVMDALNHPVDKVRTVSTLLSLLPQS